MSENQLEQKQIQIERLTAHAHDLEAKLEVAVEALRLISVSCPLILADRNGMYDGSKASNMFLRSTVRRMEIAKIALEKLSPTNQVTNKEVER